MRRSLVLLLATSLIGGCHVVSGSAGAGDENVSVRADNDAKLSFNLPFAKGEVNLPQGTMSNGKFDIDGVTMIPGGTIKGFNLDAGNNGALVHLAFVAPRSPDEVRSYFLDQFRHKGDEASRSGDRIAGKARDGSSFVIDVKAAGQGSRGTIAVQSKD